MSYLEVDRMLGELRYGGGCATLGVRSIRLGNVYDRTMRPHMRNQLTREKEKVITVMMCLILGLT
jgi:hypothetical protein